MTRLGIFLDQHRTSEHPDGGKKAPAMSGRHQRSDLMMQHRMTQPAPLAQKEIDHVS